MILSLIVLTTLSPLCLSSELYDVTTIYRIDEPVGGVEFDESPMSAEIHARTNALGYPFLVAGNVVEPEIGVDIPRCVALRLSDIRCDWELDNWDWTIREDAPLLDTGDWSELEVTGLASKYLKFDDALFIRFDGLVHNQSYIHMVLTPNRAYLQNQERFYYLQLSRLHQSFFHRCDNRIFERFTRFKDLDENIISIHCDRIANITVQMERWSYGKVDAENYILIEISKNGTIQLWNTKTKTAPMIRWVDPNPIPINFLTIRTDEAGNAQVKAINYGKGQVLSMSRNVNVASITSPPLSLSSNKLCVSIVYYTHGSTTPTVITVSSANLTVMLGELNYQKDGWKIARFKESLPDSMAEEELRVHIKSVKNEGVFEIQRIAGCNADDDEDIATISVLGGFSTPSERLAYSVAVMPQTEASQDLEFVSVGDCENGGLLFHNDKCACPAGFTGDRCQTGCGANRYGHDCGGLCSLREQACRGLTLCTPFLGCFCAPGYKGYFCNQTCDGKQYGAGCSQRCNNCAGRCDIYTGVCTTLCKPGYYPPYCNHVYAYTQFAPNVNTSSYGEVVVSPDLYNTLGHGKPTFFEVQYKPSETSSWLSYQSLPIAHASDPDREVTIRGLHHGTKYDVRIILIDQDLNSYQGPLVPHKQFLTKCFVPDEYDYNLDIKTTDTKIIASWEYSPDDSHNCPVVNYELSWQEGWRWLSRNVSGTTAQLINKLPVTEYRLRVRALTSADYASYSDIVTVRTAKRAPGPVANVTLIYANSSSLTLTWDPPQDKAHYNIKYVVDYKCSKYAACLKKCPAGGEAHVITPHVTLQGLQPLAQYLVTVSAVDGTVGENVSVVHATQHAVPSEVVGRSTREPSVTDSSVTVYWEPVIVCSGFFQEYAYQLFQGNDDATILSSGITKDTFATFEGLEAKKTYKIKVFVVTSGGWNSEMFHSINVTTKSSAPEAVQHLAVYKSGRQMVGLRWARPARVFGDLHRFLVKYTTGAVKSAAVQEVEIEPRNCDIWPLWYCHTLTDLVPDTQYSVTVRAQNQEVSAYGPATEPIEAITSEKAPEKPTNVQVVNITSSSFTLSWGFPLRANGVLRSFLVTISETERVDYQHCCKPFPNIEVPVESEKPTYDTEVVGLNPASTYAVSVTGKTIVMGASESLTVHTRPPSLPLTSLPEVELPTGHMVQWQPQDLAGTITSDMYKPLVRGHLLLALSQGEDRTPDTSGISDMQLFSALQSVLNSTFFVIQDYRGNVSLELNTSGMYEGLWGSCSWVLRQSQPYVLAAVQVVKYFKTYSVDVVYSNQFTIVLPTYEDSSNELAETPSVG